MSSLLAMARLSRVVVPGLPHHVTQRAARRMRVFFSTDDYRRYAHILAGRAREYDLDIWAYCLMPNHVHLIVVPATETGLARPIGETHRRYALEINRRQGWTGHLWQERFSSFPMEDAHLLAAVRYVLMNPVRARLAKRPDEWPHSSAWADLHGESDPLADCAPLAQRIADWTSDLASPPPDGDLQPIRAHSRTGRPLGSVAFLERLEQILDRRLRPRPPGPAPGTRR